MGSARGPVPPIETIKADGDEITIIDQTLLPGEERRITLSTVEEVWEAIRSLRVRGAPAIGIAAAYGLAIAARASFATGRTGFFDDLSAARDYLSTARPTAVNLFWALDRVYSRVEQNPSEDIRELAMAVRREADNVFEEDLAICRKIGEYGAELLQGGSLLTHCNAGGLGTSGYGTALAPVYIAHERGTPLHVFVDETRPLLQGSRLTSWELARAGVESTLIADSMAATVLSRGDIRTVIVGADRVAANGDVANKIGTLGVAILAKHYGVPFYVAIPVSTIDFDLPSGGDIPIEERAPEELLSFNERIVTPPGTTVYNPAFDVTPHEYVTAFITEFGVIEPPFAENLSALRSRTLV